MLGSLLHSWSGGHIGFGSRASVGCNVAPNAWISLGYNFIGFEDEDFSSCSLWRRTDLKQ